MPAGLYCCLHWLGNIFQFSSFFVHVCREHPAAWKEVLMEETPAPRKMKEAKRMAVNEKIRIKIKGYEHATVDAAAAKIVEAAKRSGSQVSGPIPLPTDKEIITILRATHKYKDSREQFERRTHKRLIDVIRPTQKTTEALQKLEIPAGVDIVMELK